MLWSFSASVLTVLVSSSSYAAAVPAPQHDVSPRLVHRTLPPSTNGPSPLQVTSNYAEITKVQGSGNRFSAARLKRYGSKKLRDIEDEQEWVVKTNFGGQDALLILDTGSSDTWMAQADFQCTNKKSQPLAPSKCKFGPAYNGTFPGGMIQDENFFIAYGDGEFATGAMGYADVAIGGMKVKNQEVALVNKAFWQGDGISSGLVGFAYSSLTSAFIGTNTSADDWNVTGTAPGDSTPYSPFIQTMISQGLNPPLFSLALQRTSGQGKNIPGGYVAFGGLPPVAVNPVFASTPIELYEWYEYPSLEAKARSFYTITIDGYVYKNKTTGVVSNNPTSIPGIVDSGTTLLYVPTEVYEDYIVGFNPPVTVRDYTALVPCSSTPEPFGMKIGGTVFNISAADLVVPGGVYKRGGVDYCYLGVQDGGSGLLAFPIFGDVFLKNVVAVFDIGSSIMRFAQHNY